MSAYSLGYVYISEFITVTDVFNNYNNIENDARQTWCNDITSHWGLKGKIFYKLQLNKHCTTKIKYLDITKMIRNRKLLKQIRYLKKNELISLISIISLIKKGNKVFHKNQNLICFLCTPQDYRSLNKKNTLTTII